MYWRRSIKTGFPVRARLCLHLLVFWSLPVDTVLHSLTHVDTSLTCVTLLQLALRLYWHLLTCLSTDHHRTAYARALQTILHFVLFEMRMVTFSCDRAAVNSSKFGYNYCSEIYCYLLVCFSIIGWKFLISLCIALRWLFLPLTIMLSDGLGIHIESVA